MYGSLLTENMTLEKNTDDKSLHHLRIIGGNLKMSLAANSYPSPVTPKHSTFIAAVAHPRT